MRQDTQEKDRGFSLTFFVGSKDMYKLQTFLKGQGIDDIPTLACHALMNELLGMASSFPLILISLSK